jgi:hypothetical protein
MTVTSTGGKCFDFVNGATNNIVENSSVIGYNIASTSTSFYAIGSTNSAVLDENNTIRNNYIRYGSFGIWWYGYSSAPYESGLVVENNVIVDAYNGCYLQYLNAPTINRNTFNVLNSTNTSSMACRMNNIYNAAQITRNVVNGRLYGLYLASMIGTSSVRPMVSNNSITAHQTTASNCYAFYSTSNQYTDIMHNSVFSVNQFANSGYSTYSFYDGSSSYTTVQNNIFRDSSTVSSFSYAAYLSPSTGTTYDYNNYFVESGNTNLAYHSSYGNFSPALWTTFRTVNYGGANSVNVNPNWFGMFNLRHRNLSLNAGLNLISQVAIDIDGQPRTTTVTMGADEYKLYPNDAGISQIISNPPCLGVSNVVVQLTNYGSNTLTTSTINWSINSVAQPAYSWSGSVATGSSVNVTVGTYNFTSGSFLTAATSTLPNGMTDGEPFNDGNAATSFASMNARRSRTRCSTG